LGILQRCYHNAVLAFLPIDSWCYHPATGIVNLDFISGAENVNQESRSASMFRSDADIVDDTGGFIDLDSFSLINCADGLFTIEAALFITGCRWASSNE